jgi:hypothetical protein
MTSGIFNISLSDFINLSDRVKKTVMDNMLKQIVIKNHYGYFFLIHLFHYPDRAVARMVNNLAGDTAKQELLAS